MPRLRCVRLSARLAKIVCVSAMVALLIHGATVVPPAFAQARAPRKQVLVIHSYHQGYAWTDRINQGIQETLGRADCDIHVEYLDAKHFSRETVFPIMARLMAEKYRDAKFDIVMTSDDSALDFALEQRARLFPGAPLVFCGLNDYSPQRVSGHRDCTGVAENFNLAGTLGLMLGLHPQTRQVAVVSDVTPTGQLNLKRLREVAPRFQARVKFLDLAGLTAGELTKRLRELPQDSLVLNLSFWREPGGRSFGFHEGLAIVARASSVPMYSPWGHMICEGAVGGLVISGELQGKEAARLALMILGGKPASEIPVITETPDLPLFDYDALRRFNISLDKLPRDSVVLNKPQNFYQRYRLLIWLTAAFILAQSVAIVALGINIGRRRRAETALKGSEQRYRDLFDSISDLIYTQDLDGRFLNVNRALADFLGRKREEIIGRAAVEFMPLETADSFEHNYLKTLREKGHHEGIVAYLDRRGKKHYLEYRNALVRPQSGPPYISGSGHEVTERMQTEKQLRFLQRQLMQSQKMEAIGTLAGGIAHDFNNILGVVLGYTELALAQTQNGNAAQEELQAVLQACERGRDLVKQILAFSRQGEPQRQTVDLAVSISEGLKLVRASLPRTIEIKSSSICKRALAVADPTQLHQVLMNLCANAAHAMREKGGILAVGLSEVELDESEAQEYPPLKAGSYYMIMVSDTGHGMSREVLDRVFEPFFTTKPQGEGTGMGLAMVHGIVSAHGGAIRVWSAPGQGSRFEILLPKAQETAQAKPSAAEPPMMGGQERIMVVDDEPDILEVLQRALRNQGYKVEAFGDSRKALQAIKDRPQEFDLLFTDQTMPGLTGAGLAREALMVRPDLPVVLCTGFSESIDQEQALDLGVREFVMKPVLMADLARAVRRALDGGARPGLEGAVC